MLASLTGWPRWWRAAAWRAGGACGLCAARGVPGECAHGSAHERTPADQPHAGGGSDGQVSAAPLARGGTPGGRAGQAMLRCLQWLLLRPPAGLCLPPALPSGIAAPRCALCSFESHSARSATTSCCPAIPPCSMNAIVAENPGISIELKRAQELPACALDNDVLVEVSGLAVWAGAGGMANVAGSSSPLTSPWHPVARSLAHTAPPATCVPCPCPPPPACS